MPTELRKSGIDIVGAIPWGAHFCHFYETKEDLLDILIPYFKAGLENNEFCLWIVFPPQSEEEMKGALRLAIPGVEQRLTAGDMEILPHSRWFFVEGSLDFPRVMARWQERLAQALARGYDGMRVNANEAWLTKEEWREFSAYEETLDNYMAGQRMIALCAYRASLISAAGLFDVTRTHQFAIARRYGKWEVVETPELKQAKAELATLTEVLEARILERTGELAARNQELVREVAERKAAEERLRDYSRLIHAMSAHLVEMEEAARQTMSRELHDRIGQILAALNVNLTIIRGQISGDLGDKIVPRIDDSLSLIEETGSRVRDMISDLRPPVLDDYGLVAALRWYGKKFTSRTGITVRVRGKEISLRPDPKVETVLFRIVQEALTNIAKHAKATKVVVIVTRKEDSLRLLISDDGIGFHPSEQTGSGRQRGWGLITMKERSESLGGSFRIESRPRRGSRVVVKVPR